MSGAIKIKTAERAYAKINLFLEITGKRPDGYHTIDSVMHRISLHDTVEIECDSSLPDKISVVCDLPELNKIGCNNLAYMAAEKFAYLYRKHTQISCGSIDITIEKNIPLAAGLAGGSSDAAAVLRGLNGLFNNPFSDKTLLEIAATLGADVPFCLSRSPMHCCGIGENMSPCHSLPDCTILLAVGKWAKKSTGIMYKELDAVKKGIFAENRMLAALEGKNISEVCGALYNAFELVNPHAELVRSEFIRLGASGALLSGSGPSVFGIFSSEKAAINASRSICNDGFRVFLCTPVD